MSSLQHDFHSSCVACRGVDCDNDNRRKECADVGDVVMTNYVKHKLSLHHKLQSKGKLKETVATAVVTVNSADIAMDVAASDKPASPIPPSVSSDPPVPDDDRAHCQVLGVIFLARLSRFLTALRNLWKTVSLVLIGNLARWFLLRLPM